jgi:hypothetical protein
MHASKHAALATEPFAPGLDPLDTPLDPKGRQSTDQVMVTNGCYDNCFRASLTSDVRWPMPSQLYMHLALHSKESVACCADVHIV